MSVRQATAADSDAVVALWHAGGLTRPWNDPVADCDRALRGAASTVLVIDSANTLVGSVMVGDDGHRGWIYYLAVDPAARGKGWGRMLMAAAQDGLMARGCPKLQLMVRDNNAAALGFYAALGLDPQAVVVFGKRMD